MRRYIECKSITAYKDVTIYDETMEPAGTIRFRKRKKPYPITVETRDNGLINVLSRPLKRHGRYELFDANDASLATIDIGVKIIHSVIRSDTYYFAKASFWKMYYQLFDNRLQVGELKVVRQDGKRWFQIDSSKDDIVHILALFLLAHAIRIKSLMN